MRSQHDMTLPSFAEISEYAILGPDAGLQHRTFRATGHAARRRLRRRNAVCRRPFVRQLQRSATFERSRPALRPMLRKGLIAAARPQTARIPPLKAFRRRVAARTGKALAPAC